MDLFGFANQVAAGAGVEAAHRFGAGSVFARGWIGKAWDRGGLEGEALAGVRLQW